jgi:hypothetical protein
MWQHHLTVLIVLGALALPVYLADHYLLRPQGDGERFYDALPAPGTPTETRQ